MRNRIKLGFRPDIEGLRAVAILAVLIFHINPFYMPGGYTGVDIFFVISGFLITSNIRKENAAGGFGIGEFYLKRARRLLPALTATLLATTIFVYVFYLPSDARNFGLSLISSAIFASNIYFFTKSGYFDNSGETSPLLHTWSLSVEEQFYLFFPFLIFFLVSKGRQRAWLWLTTLALTSLIASEIGVRLAPNAAFYLSPFRSFEFIAGALVTFAPPINAERRKIREVLAGLGALMIFASVALLSHTEDFPGLAALLPALGTALFIYAAENTLVGKIGGTKPALAIGRISYSVYLWHWPLIVFYKYLFSPHLLRVEQAGLFLASLGLGFLSYRLIELPTRRWSLTDNRRQIIALTAFSISSCLIAGGVLFFSQGLPGRFSPPAQRIASYLDYKLPPEPTDCSLKPDMTVLPVPSPPCHRLGNAPSVLLIGDSHAQHYYAAFASLYPGTNIYIATQTGCRPVIGSPGEPRCTKLMDWLFTEGLRNRQFDTIIVAARWRKEDASRVPQTIRLLFKASPRVIVLGPVMEYDGPLPRILTMAIERHNPALSTQLQVHERKEVDEAMAQATRGTGALYISAIDLMCPAGKCQTEVGEVPLQFDYGHLTLDGASFLIDKMGLGLR